MRRKKNDKRVLRAGNGRNNNRSRKKLNLSFRDRNNNRPMNRNTRPNTRVKKQKKRSKRTVLLMIIVLVAFVVGAGMGVLMSFDDGTVDNETHVENVTVEMTSNLNQSNEISFDEADSVDYNQNQSSEILGAEEHPYYNEY